MIFVEAEGGRWDGHEYRGFGDVFFFFKRERGIPNCSESSGGGGFLKKTDKPNPPLYDSSTFHQKVLGGETQYDYARSGNPVSYTHLTLPTTPYV
ncbi:hypothetical protein CDFC105_30680 [Clostridioides difficile]|nr:hypothetical protein CDFC105_30680 [Clostridioides difficile]